MSLLRLKLLVNQKVLDTQIFFEITFGCITLMRDDAQVSERWAIDERKGGSITHRLQFHNLIVFIPIMPDKKFISFR